MVRMEATDDLRIGDVLDELVQETLRPLLAVTVSLIWLWACFVVLFRPQHLATAYEALLVATAASWISYHVHRRRTRLAVAFFLLGLLASTALIVAAYRTQTAFYLFVPVILITATLSSPRVMWSVALLCAALAAVWRGAVSWVDLSMVVTVFFVAALAGWLSARRLITALGWALTMTEQARRSADEAQRHRAEVRRVLKSLDEAYVRLERANEALIFAREAAEKAYRFKAEFVANVSHELRTPLNLIVGFSEMIATAPESYGGVPLPKEYRGDVMAIYRSARHLSDLINDVLDLSRIEAGKLPITRDLADLAQVVHEAADIVRGLAEARGLRLDVELPDSLPLLYFDRTRIRQVLLNLLTNATRFTDAGRILVRVRVDRDRALVTVEDTGRGIPEDRLARAFEAFTQLDENTLREGSGLGLAVSKKFVELHGGDMWITSEVGRGTTVGFSLPLPDREATAPSAVHWMRISEVARGKPVVLVLHDDPRVVTILKRYMEGYEFVLASTPDEARDLAAELAPQLIVEDASWRNRVAEGPWGEGVAPEVPVIRCTLPNAHQIGLSLGAHDYLPKPITRQELKRALDRLGRPVRTVLVVDDDPHVVRLLARMLKAEDPDLRVLEAFNGADGLAIAREHRPDVVLLDLIMPRLSGYEVLKELSACESLRDTAVIVVSVRAMDQEMARMPGEMRIACPHGFSLSETLSLLRAVTRSLTGLEAESPAIAAPV